MLQVVINSSVVLHNFIIFSCGCVGCVWDVNVCPQFNWFMIWKSIRKSFSLRVNFEYVLVLQYNNDNDLVFQVVVVVVAQFILLKDVSRLCSMRVGGSH